MEKIMESPSFFIFFLAFSLAFLLFNISYKPLNLAIIVALAFFPLVFILAFFILLFFLHSLKNFICWDKMEVSILVGLKD